MELNLTKSNEVKEKSVKEKTKEINSQFNFKGVSNYFKLLFINFKLANQHIGTIVTGIIFLITNLIFVTIEAVNLADPESAKNMAGPMKGFWFIFGIMTMLIFLFTVSLYLIKKQNIDGIQNIELRAGFSVWKSFSIRVIAINLVVFQYLLILLFIALILPLITGANYGAFNWIVLSQIGGMFFIAFVFSPVICLITSFFRTTMASMYSMLFAVVFSTSIMISGALSGSTTIKAISKTTTRYKYSKDFYDSLKDTTASVIFEDKGENSDKSRFLTTIEKNAKDIFEVDEYLGSLDDLFGYMKPSIDEEQILEQFYYNQITRVFGTGQIYYLQGEKTLLSGTNLYDKFLMEITKTALENYNNNKFSLSNKDQISVLINQPLYNSPFKNNTSIFDFNNFTNVMLQSMSQYTQLFELFNRAMTSLQLLSITDASNTGYGFGGSNNGQSTGEMLTTKSIFNSFNFNETFRSDYGSDYKNNMIYNYSMNYADQKHTPFNLNDKNLNKENQELEKLYQELPELALFNWFVISAWKYSMNLSLVVDEGSKFSSGKEIKDNTQLMARYFRNANSNFSLFDNYIYTLTNANVIDPYVEDVALQNWIFVNRTNSSYIKNIYDFDKYVDWEYEDKKVMEPVFEKINMEFKVKSNVAGFITLHIFISLALLVPSYYAYRKKLRI